MRFLVGAACLATNGSSWLVALSLRVQTKTMIVVITKHRSNPMRLEECIIAVRMQRAAIPMASGSGANVFMFAAAAAARCNGRESVVVVVVVAAPVG